MNENEMKITVAQCSSTHLQRPRALARLLGERSEPLQVQGLCCSLFMQSAGRRQDCYARSVCAVLEFVAQRYEAD